MDKAGNHPFDRYAEFTDVEALKAISDRSLRKSVRVNTLKQSVEDFRSYASSKNWKLEQIPWCPEGFFIDREDRAEGIGKDLAHLLGRFYIQEAASMLPVALLDPKPGDKVLDMSAAPGSKTTQIGARTMGQGTIIANDMQEKRLWTLKNGLHRSGVANILIIKKVGQWYARHMTERFDKVLCDAPCTAQGTARKDSDALKYCSLENIEKMSRLQFALLESAIHSAKTGGTIVYSTCTLAPEENELLVNAVVERFAGQVEVVDPRTLSIAPEGYFEPAINDALRVQQKEPKQNPYIRLWPQTYDTEGFFCAVLKKVAPTRAIDHMDRIRFIEDEMPRSRRREIEAYLQDCFGTSFLRPDDQLYSRGEMLLVTNDATAHFMLPVADYSLGLPFGKALSNGRVLPSHEILTLRGEEATKQTTDLSEDDFAAIFDGRDATCDPALNSHVLMRYKGVTIGLGLAKEGRLKNNIPRWMIDSGERSHA